MGLHGEVRVFPIPPEHLEFSMTCRKCGAKKITKRRAGVFWCRRCGMQPGQLKMDRAGIPAKRTEDEAQK
ncbi:hypothetical protein MACH17_18210 [Phaeobacter inhibens]|nr:hypothetical protein MACH17_18210 [Phaeobacter inhibens]